MDGEVIKYLSHVNQKIRRGCTAHITKTGRLYYMNHETKTSSWLPPVESWDSGGIGLPYGWEAAFDRDGKTYFINHVNRTTTNEDPRKDSDEEPPQPRDIELVRDPQKGFGFVAGSEKPVIVRFVTEDGPSEGKLLPGDQILEINGEDVMKSPRERVIELVRSCKHTVKLRVCQPFANNTTRKSALLTAAKKAKLKSNPSRVRFAEGVVINGSPLYSPSPFDATVPFIPNVLKVFLENGQTKSFKYDTTTTVQDVLNVLQEKLSISSLEHFSLVVEHIKAARRNKISILNPKDTLAKIAARPGSHNLRCLLRITFVPKDIYEFMQKDPVAFDYFYVQCCNDVIHERLASELKYDVALRLAALHLQQHALASGIQGKLTVKTIEREFGLEKFVPISLLETMKRKELLKLLSQLMKQNQALSGPGQKQLSANQAKFHYLKIVSELPSYGAKYLITCSRNSAMDSAVLIGPKIGISQVSTIRNIAPMNLAQFSELDSVEVTREDDFSYKIRIKLRNPEKECLVFFMEDRETEEFVLVLERYFNQLVGEELCVEWEGRDPEPVETVPTYHSRHTVQESPWSYCPPSGSPPPQQGSIPRLRSFDLSVPPPPYIPCEERQLSRSNSRDQFSIATSPTSVDHNMNEMEALVAALSSLPNFKKSTSEISLTKDSSSQDQSGITVSVGSDGGPESSRTLQNLADKPDTIAAQLQSQVEVSSGMDMHSIVTMELLEEEKEDDDTSVVQQIDVKSNDVMQRVSEMNRIVSDAERYLNNDDPGQYEVDLASKCQDSLLFIRRNEEDGTSYEQVITPSSDVMPSESEAESTPTNSPTHYQASVTESPRTVARKMWSSFGLHTPHILASMDQETEDVEELLRQLQESTDLPIGESALCLDPDIIDLTVVPPPSASDMDFSHGTPDTAEVSPKTYFGFQPPNFELSISQSNEGGCISSTASSQIGCQQFYSSHPGILFSNSTCYGSSYYSCSSSSSAPSSSSGYESCSATNSLTAEDDDLSAYIIPPPPPGSSSLVEEQNRVLARFREAAEEVRRMVAQGHDTLSCSKYADSINSVSKFCTIPRRHDETHRTPLSSLASLVTPIRETHGKSFASAFGGTTDVPGSMEPSADSSKANHKMGMQGPVNGISDGSDGGQNNVHYRAEDDSGQRPRRPPRQKKHGPATASADLAGMSTVEDFQLESARKTRVNGYPDGHRGAVRSNGYASVNQPVNGLNGGGTHNGGDHETSQETTFDRNCAPEDYGVCHGGNHPSAHQSYRFANGHVNGSDGSTVPDLSAAYESAVMSTTLLNGYGNNEHLNGVCNGYESESSNEPTSLPDDILIKDCRVCLDSSKNGFVNGCTCRKLGQFRSHHQSLPRKTINSGLGTIPVTVIDPGPHASDDERPGNGVQETGVFRDAKQEITEMVLNLDSACQLRLKECSQSEQLAADPIKLAKARETLMTESRQFVTASKMFVRSLTESSDKMEENLVMCLALLDRIFAASEQVVMEMTKPSQINNLVEKLREMALAYSRTISAAHCAASGEIPNHNMAGLMHQASSLATSLTTLMRTLRSFHMP